VFQLRNTKGIQWIYGFKIILGIFESTGCIIKKGQVSTHVISLKAAPAGTNLFKGKGRVDCGIIR
jgi:hypothetical protein